jgi:hypothetical protein
LRRKKLVKWSKNDNVLSHLEARVIVKALFWCSQNSKSQQKGCNQLAVSPADTLNIAYEEIYTRF